MNDEERAKCIDRVQKAAGELRTMAQFLSRDGHATFSDGKFTLISDAIESLAALLVPEKPEPATEAGATRLDLAGTALDCAKKAVEHDDPLSIAACPHFVASLARAVMEAERELAQLRSQKADVVYVVRDSDRWGESLNVVRASSEDAAVRFVRPEGPVRRHLINVEKLTGDSGVLWCRDESPDSRPNADE
jgi:hypothetical protein